MANAKKKVIVRTLTGETLAGYLPATGLRGPEGEVALLNLEARMIRVALTEIRHIAYVRDFNLGDADDPERLSRKTFPARPRTEGLWLRLTLVGGEVLEGLAALDVGLADGWIEERGVFLTPPDVRSNTQRLFVPRTAIGAMQMVAVITTPSKARPEPAGPRAQTALFP